MVASIFPQGTGGAFSGQKILFGFAGASSAITSACASAAGWDSAVIDPLVAAGPSVISYVWDQPSGWIWVCSTSPAAFDERASPASRAKPAVVDGFRSALGDLIFNVATGSPAGLSGGANWEQELASLLASYAGTTQTWRLAAGFPSGGHFIVLNYRKPDQRGSMLRPFSLPQAVSARELLPVERLRELLGQVVDMDLARHPEWFE